MKKTDNRLGLEKALEPTVGFVDIQTAAVMLGNLPISTIYQLTSRPRNPLPARKHGKRLAFYWPEIKQWSDRENGIVEIA